MSPLIPMLIGLMFPLTNDAGGYTYAYIPYTAPHIVQSEEARLKQQVWDVARQKGLSVETTRRIHRVIECESGWNPSAVGDGGTSFGLVQIHLPEHPHIRKTQALDADFAIDFITDGFRNGYQWKWTCWKMHFAVE